MTKKVRVEIELELPDAWAGDKAHPGEVCYHLYDILLKNGRTYSCLMYMQSLQDDTLSPAMKEAMKKHYDENTATYDSAVVTRCAWDSEPRFNLLEAAGNPDYKRKDHND